MIVFTPRPDKVHINAACITIVIADASSTVADSVNTKSTPLAIDAGGRSAYRSRPASGNRIAANTTIGTERSVVVAVRNATVRANQNVYRSSGRNNSYATAP